MTIRRAAVSTLAATLLAAWAAPAAAFPGFFAYQGGRPINRSTHVVLMKKGESTVVTVMPDYEGDLKPFAVVMPVPADVKAEEVRSLRRDFVDRVDQLGAPKFHEFWEMDPCEQGKNEQEWERDLTVSGSGFLGMDMGGGGGEGPKFKPAKEMSLTVDVEFKKGEQTVTLVPPSEAEGITAWLERKGFKAPDGAGEVAARYARAGMAFLVVEVDTRKVELMGGDRAIISPIRYATAQPVSIPSTIGLLNLDDKQELFVHVIHPDQRFEAKNYENQFPPTNIEVDFKVKERMGEFYAALHDRLLAKRPLAFVNEYAWSTKECGQPCPNEPLLIHELLALGGDVFEASVPKEERHPEPPELTEEEKKILDEIKDKKKKEEIDELRTETARRRALVARHYYVLSRMHHRYDRSTLPKDVEVGPAGHVRGGVEAPKGPKGDLPTDVKSAAESLLQTRFTSLHASPAVPHCEAPERHRWGKAPRTYRGLRKIWVALDTATKNRKSHSPEKLVYTPIPSLELAGQPTMVGGVAERLAMAPPAPSASAAAGEGAAGEKKGGCGCRTPAGNPAGAGAAALAGLGLALGALWRRRFGR